MKKIQGEDELMVDELRDEYQFDYSKAKPNRFAAKLVSGGRLVVLAPELSAAFPTEEAVNAALRRVVEWDRVKPEIPVAAT